MNIGIALLVLSLTTSAAAQAPLRAAVLAAATEIIQKAHYSSRQLR